MGIKTIVLLVILLVIVMTVIFIEFHVELSERYYECYRNRMYRGKAENFKCAGKNKADCDDCPYHKKFNKEIRKNEITRKKGND